MAPLPWPTIAPLFWQHGEAHDVLLEEMRRMHAAGIRAFILESRPHPDFAGPRWWSDLDVIVAEARRLGMQAWIFDDRQYPTGFANGAIRDAHPERGKRFLRRERIEAAGPLPGASFRLGAWCAPGESLAAAVAGRLADAGGRLDPASLRDVTPAVRDGILYWDVPPGRWRVFVFVLAASGGEAWTKDYLNPLDPEATRVLLEAVYEPHFARYGAEFGRTIAGFFSDEPRFGNVGAYDALIGRTPMVLPWRDGLLDDLSAAWGGSFVPALPCLWEDAGHLSARARSAYMDLVSRLYAECFSRPIGDWCRAHGVRHIGHVVEDNGAHARLGYGAGHFFRAISGQDASGFDLVYQLWPGFAEGRYLTPFGDLDARFFSWGIAKLATSAAHLDARKDGRTACEIFGAYGWRLGLRMMKWLTDHACVRGANLLIPHAFSPKEFPDPDCPPHFFARGCNPQWRHFGVWSAYADRVCRALSDGVHVATAAVLYHAEAEWAGACDPFESAVRELALAQIDCDVVPADALVDPPAASLDRGRLAIGRERFAVVVVPYAEVLPAAVLRRLHEAAGAGVPVVFCRALPRASTAAEGERDPILSRLRRHPRVRSAAPGMLAALVKRWRLHDVEATPSQPHLRIYRYHTHGRDAWFLVNESLHDRVRTRLALRGFRGTVAAWDALEDRRFAVPQRATRAGAAVEVRLEPFESLFLLAVEARDGTSAGEAPSDDLSDAPARALAAIGGPWEVATATAAEYPSFTPCPLVNGLGNVAVPGRLPRFSGTIRYRCRFDAAPVPAGSRAVLDLGEVHETAEAWLNGTRLGVRICPPYRFDAGSALASGSNDLAIEVTNTLVHAHGDNGLDRAMPVDPSGLVGPVRLLG